MPQNDALHRLTGHQAQQRLQDVHLMNETLDVNNKLSKYFFIAHELADNGHFDTSEEIYKYLYSKYAYNKQKWIDDWCKAVKKLRGQNKDPSDKQ